MLIYLMPCSGQFLVKSRHFGITRVKIFGSNLILLVSRHCLGLHAALPFYLTTSLQDIDIFNSTL